MSRRPFAADLVVAAAVASAVPMAPAVAAAPRSAAPVVPDLTVGSVGVWEGDAGTSAVSIPVDLSVPTTTKVVVDYTLVSDSATSSVDYVARHGKLTFTPGAVSKAITVVVRGDTDVEADEHFDVQVTGVSGANATQPTGTDYDAAHIGTLTFGPGQQSKSIGFYVSVDVVVEDFVQMFLESISVALGPAVVHEGTGNVSIIDNDGSGPPTPPAFQLGEIRRASVATDDTHGNSDCCMSDTSSISADGRYVAFTSRSTDLAPGATPNHEHVYLRDRVTASTRLVADLGIDPVGGWSDFGGVTLSADGRYLAFNDIGSQYVSGDTNHCVDTFVYDAFVQRIR